MISVKKHLRTSATSAVYLLTDHDLSQETSATSSQLVLDLLRGFQRGLEVLPHQVDVLFCIGELPDFAKHDAGAADERLLGLQVGVETEIVGRFHDVMLSGQ